VLNYKHQSWPQSVRNLWNEFEVIRNFDKCEYVLQYYDFIEAGKAIDERGKERTVSYIVMEYCEYSLLNLMNDIATEESVQYIFTELLKAVSQIHSWGFYHWDIKPDNILLTKDYKLKIIDFGFCTDRVAGMAGEKVGTVNYNSWESLLGKEFMNE